MSIRITLATAALAAAIAPVPALAWGSEGHVLVAAIARERLTPETRAKVDAILAQDPATPPAERILALKYVLHFVGDMHQPLHMADNHDHGGNCVLISLGAPRAASLHSYWDSVVVGELGKDAHAILARLNGDITPELIAQWSQGDFASWGKETNAVAVSVAYSFPTPPRCERDVPPLELPKWYDSRAQAAAATQLERAGVRLAAVLEKALGPLSLAQVSGS